MEKPREEELAYPIWIDHKDEILCAFTLGIGNLWLNPYKNASVAAFYREISGTEQPAFNPPQDNGPTWSEN